MTTRSYYVHAEHRRWLFEIDGNRYGPDTTERDAVAAARADAAEAGATDVKIYTRDREGAWRLRGSAGETVG
jgi:hypothetical protein